MIYEIENKILLSLPLDEYDYVIPKLEAVDLQYGKVLYNSGSPIKHVFFPNNGMCSLLSSTEDGSTVEVGMVGNEGMVGVPVILGVKCMPYRVTYRSKALP
jgi:CRP-like cAMP-binding protein